MECAAWTLMHRITTEVMVMCNILRQYNFNTLSLLKKGFQTSQIINIIVVIQKLSDYRRPPANENSRR